LAQHEQPVVDRETPPPGAFAATRRTPGLPAPETAAEAELAARAMLRSQIAKLESELSRIVAQRFPFIAPVEAPAAPGGPRLMGLEELERTRDGLAGRLSELRRRTARRSEHEHHARDLLERM